MTIHKEGYPTIILTVVFITLLQWVANYFFSHLEWVFYIVTAISVFLLVVVLQFFRHPVRNITRSDDHVIAPADGKVVVIEETMETEVLKIKCIQVSIFMSPINVHVNRYPVSGKISFTKYHPGLFLVAWHPKSSTDNERTTVVIETGSQHKILLRQIAGALARRIVLYAKTGIIAKQGDEMGFIKFGSRVDLFLPLGTKVNVQLDQVVRGGETVIAELN